MENLHSIYAGLHSIWLGTNSDPPLSIFWLQPFGQYMQAFRMVTNRSNAQATKPWHAARTVARSLIPTQQQKHHQSLTL